MRTSILILISFLTISTLNAQISEMYPTGFKKGNVSKSYRQVSNAGLNNSESLEKNINVPPYRLSQSPFVAPTTSIIGTTKFDLQTYRSVLNNFSVNFDGTVSACYNHSPDANTSSNPPYPYRGTGYNYLDPIGWTHPYPGVPYSLGPPTTPRSGWPNVVVTPSGKELLIQHSNITGTAFNKITMHSRPVKGIGTWTTNQTFWTNIAHYVFPRACGGVTNENVYAIWLEDDTIGPNLLYFSMSTNGGVSWTPEVTIAHLTNYPDIIPDCYSIDARGDTVAISIGYEFTDLMLLKSTDAGLNWTKTIIQKHPIPQFAACTCTTNYIQDGIPVDTIRANGGDSKVLVDNDGMCHVWFSALDYFTDSATRHSINTHTDNLFYWNENMGTDTTTIWNSLTGGNGHYVAIAKAEDFSGNGIIDLPHSPGPPCTEVVGEYGMGLTQMPSAGIDANGKIYLSYSTINELADTSFNLAHRHVYTMSLPYPYVATNWSQPMNIIPMISAGGNGELEECVFASMSRNVLNDTAFIMYQVDLSPGVSTYYSGSCQTMQNINQVNFIRVWGVPNFTTNINGFPALESINSAFPNPCFNEFTLPINAKNKIQVNIELRDITGKLLFSRMEKCNSGINQIKISTEELSKGIYFCSVITNRTISTQKIVVE